MVPVFYDLQRRKTKVWVMLGYSAKPATISFKVEPKVTIKDRSGKKTRKKVEFKTQETFILYPVTAEVYTNKILNRAEFQDLCNKYKSQRSIIKAIEMIE